MRRCLTGPTQTVDTEGDVWILRVMCGSCVTNEEVFNTANTNSGYRVMCGTVTNEEVFNRANTNSGYSG